MSYDIDSYDFADIPGWSLNKNMNCYGEDIGSPSAENTPYDCVTRCILEVTCEMVVYVSEDKGCWLKAACSQMVTILGLNTYRMLGKLSVENTNKNCCFR